MFCSQAAVEGPRLQGARRQGREIQIGFVLTGMSSQKAVIILMYTYIDARARVFLGNILSEYHPSFE
jgi:hypothetical protein